MTGGLYLLLLVLIFGKCLPVEEHVDRETSSAVFVLFVVFSTASGGIYPS